MIYLTCFIKKPSHVIHPTCYSKTLFLVSLIRHRDRHRESALRHRRPAPRPAPWRCWLQRCPRSPPHRWIHSAASRREGRVVSEASFRHQGRRFRCSRCFGAFWEARLGVQRKPVFGSVFWGCFLWTGPATNSPEWCEKKVQVISYPKEASIRIKGCGDASHRIHQGSWNNPQNNHLKDRT